MTFLLLHCCILSDVTALCQTKNLLVVTRLIISQPCCDNKKVFIHPLRHVLDTSKCFLHLQSLLDTYIHVVLSKQHLLQQNV